MMKFIFVSDIHGKPEMMEECVKILKKENADKLVILGDTAAQIDTLANEEIANIINNMKENIEMIRGNCDNKHLEELLEITLFDMDNLYVNGKVVTITHGHYYNYYNRPSNCGEIFIQGHTHVPMLQKNDGIIMANPGSLGRPKGTDLRCYLLMDDEKIELKTIDGKVVKDIKF